MAFCGEIHCFCHVNEGFPSGLLNTLPIRRQAITWTNADLFGQLDPWEQTSVKFESQYKIFHSWICIWRYHLRNGGYFVQGEMTIWYIDYVIYCVGFPAMWQSEVDHTSPRSTWQHVLPCELTSGLDISYHPQSGTNKTVNWASRLCVCYQIRFQKWKDLWVASKIFWMWSPERALDSQSYSQFQALRHTVSQWASSSFNTLWSDDIWCQRSWSALV